MFTLLLVFYRLDLTVKGGDMDILLERGGCARISYASHCVIETCVRDRERECVISTITDMIRHHKTTVFCSWSF